MDGGYMLAGTVRVTGLYMSLMLAHLIDDRYGTKGILKLAHLGIQCDNPLLSMSLFSVCEMA